MAAMHARSTNKTLALFPWLARRQRVAWEDMDPVGKERLLTRLRRLRKRTGLRWRVAWIYRTFSYRVLLRAPGGWWSRLFYRPTREKWEKAWMITVKAVRSRSG